MTLYKLPQKKLNKDKKGQLVISLDFELFWGVHDVFSKEAYSANIYGAHEAVPAILNLFEQYGIQATWAVVGLLNFNNMEELKMNIPHVIPEYKNKPLSPYYFSNGKQVDDKEKDLFFAPELIKAIENTPGQEIGSHTFSHYYCLEKGQTIDAFIEDMKSFDRVIKPQGTRAKSIIFPRNQINRHYLKKCWDFGFISYRGNESGWFYRIKPNEQRHFVKRILRWLDLYINLTGHQTFTVQHPKKGVPVNIPGSRQLRPVTRSPGWMEKRRLARILNSMTYAAKKGETYHLWWHPHNFGIHLQENLNFLTHILHYYDHLNTLYGFQSMNMGQVASPIVHHHYKKMRLQKGAVR